MKEKEVLKKKEENRRLDKLNSTKKEREAQRRARKEEVRQLKEQEKLEREK